MTEKPIIVAVEGVDGVGKDTFIDKTMKFLNKKGIKTCKINAVSDSLLGKRIRATLKSKLNDLPDNLILAAAFTAETVNASCRIYDLANLKSSELPDVIFLNRWIYSTYAYNTDTEEERMAVYDMIDKAEVVLPDYIVHLDLPINLIIERLGKRTGKDFEAFEEEDKLIKVKNNYEKIFNNRDIYLKNDNFFFFIPRKIQNKKIKYKKFETYQINQKLINGVLEWIKVL